MFPYFDARNLISGRMGTILANINGESKILTEVQDLDIDFDFIKKSYLPLGSVFTRHKSAGCSGKGSFKYFQATSEWAEICAKYANTFRTTYFTLNVTNVDPSTWWLGAQSILFQRCSLDGGRIAGLGADKNFAEGNLTFTYEGLNILTSHTPVIGRLPHNITIRIEG